MEYQAPSRRQVLIAAAPDDQQAASLAEELRMLGISVILAETIEQASEADRIGICIVVLRAGMWRTTPVITTAIRSNPRYLIPVLTEFMPLPRAAWTTEPIIIQEPLTTTVRELVALIAPYLQGASESSPVVEKRRPSTGPLNAWPDISFQSGLRRRRRVRYVSFLIVFLLAAGLLIYYWPRLALPTSGSPRTTGGTNVVDRTYTAPAPGPGCDLGGADWTTGDHFKTIITPTAGATAPPQKTPTLQVVADSSTVTLCQQNGLLVKHNDHFDVYATTFFSVPGALALSHHFKTQITATAVSLSNTASFDLGVRDQNGASGDPNSGYGDDTISVDLTGRWDTQRFNDITDQIDASFTTGFIQPAKTITLAAEVNGPVMTFTLNGQQVTTIVDPTFAVSYGISFGVSDPDAKSPPSALFSHFTYTPLPETGVTNQSAVATATAQARKIFQTPYKAAVPGFGCDKGGGQWQPVPAGQDDTTARCLAQGLELAQGHSAKFVGDVSFYWLNGNFPANYKVAVQIDMSRINGGCAGVTTRATRQTGYSFFICADGSWQIMRYDNTGKGLQIAQGNADQRSSYTLEATANGPVQSLALDGVQVSFVTDKTLTATERIDLSMFPPQGASGAVVFSHFVFTPLP